MKKKPQVNGAVKIDKHVPIPARAGLRGQSKWPWKTLKVGESFVMENRDIAGASSGASLAGKRTGLRFAARTEGKNVRVWRIK